MTAKTTPEATTATKTPKTGVDTKNAETAPKTPKKQQTATTKRKAAAKPKAPTFTEARAKQWFLELSHDEFLELCKKWNERNFKIKLPKNKDYEGWLNYFKDLPPSTIRILSSSGIDVLSTEAYAALSRWHDIIKSPHRIEKLQQASLQRDKTKKSGPSIAELAAKNDQLGVLQALRDNIAAELEKGVATRDMASLSRQLIDVTDQIKALERKNGPRKNTDLAKLTGDVQQQMQQKRRRGNGARTTSFKARITIDDMENS